MTEDERPSWPNLQPASSSRPEDRARLEAHDWISRSLGRQGIIVNTTQPLTGEQLRKRAGVSLKRCSELVRQLHHLGSLECLNPRAPSSRLYWLTDTGLASQRLLYRERGKPLPRHYYPKVNWELYGRVCYRHRSAVILVLREPMQPSRLQRRAYFMDPTIRMSANNVRDVMRFLHASGIVERVRDRACSRPLYALTPLGRSYQHLLARSGERPWRG